VIAVEADLSSVTTVGPALPVDLIDAVGDADAVGRVAWAAALNT
jgi:hypothetical protein